MWLYYVGTVGWLARAFRMRNLSIHCRSHFMRNTRRQLSGRHNLHLIFRLFALLLLLRMPPLLLTPAHLKLPCANLQAVFTL